MANPFDEIDPRGTSTASPASSNPFDELDPRGGAKKEEAPPPDNAPGLYLSEPDANGRRFAAPAPRASKPAERGVVQRAREGAGAPMEEELGFSKENRDRYPWLNTLQPAARYLDVAARTPASIWGGLSGAAAGAAEKVIGPAKADRLQRDLGVLPMAVAPEVPVASSEASTLLRKPQPEVRVPPRAPPPLPPEVSAIPRQVPRPDVGVDLLRPDVPHDLPGPQSRALGAAGNGGPLTGMHPDTIAHMRQVMEEQGFNQNTIDQRLSEMSAHHFFGEITPSLEADMGAVAAPPGPGKLEVMGSVRQRALEARERSQHIFNRGFGESENLPQMKRIMEIERNREADPLYQRFRETPISPTPAIDALLPRLEAAGVLQDANRALRIEGESTARGFPIPGEPPTIQNVPTAGAFQLALEQISDRVSAAMRGGEPNVARRFTRLRNDLLAALDNHPNVGETWRQARAAYSRPAAIQDAIELGRNAMSNRISADELPFMTAGYNATQMRALRVGIRDYYEQMLGKRGTLTQEVLNNALSPNNVQKMRWAIGDAATDQFVAAMEHEQHMHGAPTRIHGGSPTALRMEANKRWTVQPEDGGMTLGDAANFVRHPVRTSVSAGMGKAEKFGVGRRRAANEARMARLREESSRIFTLQGPERDAVARHLVGGIGAQPYRQGGRIAPRERRSKLATGGTARSGLAPRAFAEGGEADDDGAMMPETFVPGPVRRWTEQAAPKDYKIIRDTIGSTAKFVAGPYELSRPNPHPPGSELEDWYEDQREKGMRSWSREGALATMGTGAIVGVPVKGAEAVFGAGAVRHPFAEGFPNVVVQRPPQSAMRIKEHPDYAAAKAGDPAAAVRVAEDAINDRAISQLRDVIGDRRPDIIPVHAMEASGHNALPAAYAEALADRLGLPVNTSIVQANRAFRTGENASYRMQHPARFHGDVTPGADHLLVDDAVTMGGTLADLHSHIGQNGGNVVGATTLMASPYSHILAPSPGTLARLREKLPDLEPWWKQTYGHGFEGLTDSEAKYLTRFRSPDAVRDRITAGERQPNARSYPQGDAGAPRSFAEPEQAGLDVGPGLAGPLGGDAGLRAAELQAERWAGERKPLEGLPRGVQVVGGEPFIPGPVARAHDVAERYMEGKDFGVSHPDKFHPIDRQHAEAIAQAFEDMKHAPNDPKVKAAYEALAQETKAQYEAIVEHGGLKVTPVNAADYPYHGNPRAVVKDVADNNHMAFFKSNEGFGSEVTKVFDDLPKETQIDIAHTLMEKVPALEKFANGRAEEVLSLLEGAHPSIPVKMKTVDPRAVDISNRSVSKRAVEKYAKLNSEPPPVVMTGSELNEGGHRIAAGQKTGRDLQAADLEDLSKMDWEAWLNGENPPIGKSDQPMLRSSGIKVGDHDMLYNDLFRVVHDYFGHVKNGNGFRGAGEDNAWRAHAAMYSPEARRAMTTETRGQNSWLNYGPHGEFNRTANGADTIYAQQKVGLLPDWVMADRAPETIRASALRHGGKMYEGPLHSDTYEAAAKASGKPFGDIVAETRPQDSGFVTSTGRFVDREAARRIANAAKQTTHEIKGDLAGEHLFGGEPVAPSAPAKPGPRYYEGEPVTNAGVDAPPNRKIQTVADPHRMMFPGIYRNPKTLAEEAAARVGPEDPAMKQLFGVTRGDLRDMAQGRVGNEEPKLSTVANPRGSLSAQNIQTPRNTQRLVDTLGEIGKHEGLRTADAWYIMDPMYQRLEQMFGPEEAARRYKHLNTTMGMASPGSDVLSEIQRGTGAHWLQSQGRFDDFMKYAGLTGDAKNSLKVPRDVRYIQGHPYHRTAQGQPMQKYFDTGSIQSEAPKVPLYTHASGVPETGFQTSGPVGDAHFSRGVGLADTRKGPTDVASSFSRPEYQTLQPWWQHDVAGKTGLESVPAQARLWTGLGPQTGVESELGAPKLELFAKQIAKAARRLGVSPETARDLILSGKAGAGVLAGATIAPRFMRSEDRPSRAEGGAVGDDYNSPVPDEAAFQNWKVANAPRDSGVDYDLRGAYLDNMQRAENGHMGDRFKKPNHPTFSDQSQYAVGDQRARAGTWAGDMFVPPAPRAFGGRVRKKK